MIPFADQSPHNELSPIKTGTLIDKLSGLNGLPRKKITEIYGDSSVGKSTLLLQAVAEAQKQGLRSLWVDVEFSYDRNYASTLGVDNSRLGLLQEEFAEETLDTVEREIREGNWDLIVIDSIGALQVRAEAEKGVGEKTIGGQAGIVAKFCRKVVPLIAIHNVALVVINHSFTDVMSGAIKTSGGKKLEYHKSLSIRLKQKFGVVLKQGDRKIGKVIVGEVKKNKLAGTEGTEAEARIIYGEGFSKSADLLEDAIQANIFTKTGNTYFLGETKIGTMNKLREWAKENQDQLKELLNA